MLEVVPFIFDIQEDLLSNTYLIKDSNNCCVVVDPSSPTTKLGDYIEKNKLTLKGILLTHTHFDHIRGVDLLTKRFKVKVYVGFEDAIGFTDCTYNCSGEHNLVIKSEPFTIVDNEELCLIEEKVKVIATPYHTQGGVCYYFADSALLFTGDSLFKHGIGRSDFPSSIRKLTKPSLQKLKYLPDDVKVFPGHGASTILGIEKATNVFLK